MPKQNLQFNYKGYRCLAYWTGNARFYTAYAEQTDKQFITIPLQKCHSDAVTRLKNKIDLLTNS